MLEGREMSRAEKISLGDETVRVRYASVAEHGRRRFSPFPHRLKKNQLEEEIDLYIDCIHVNISSSCRDKVFPREKF
jgi:hypothetical protein